MVVIVVVVSAVVVVVVAVVVLANLGITLLVRLQMPAWECGREPQSMGTQTP